MLARVSPLAHFAVVEDGQDSFPLHKDPRIREIPVSPLRCPPQARLQPIPTPLVRITHGILRLRECLCGGIRGCGQDVWQIRASPGVLHEVAEEYYGPA